MGVTNTGVDSAVRGTIELGRITRMASPRPNVSDSTWSAVEEQASQLGYPSTDEYLQVLLAESRDRNVGAYAKIDSSQIVRSNPSNDSTSTTISDQASAEAVLQRLESDQLGSAERSQLIIDAEVLPFNDAQRQRLNASLREFIERKRDSREPCDLIAVASAIRKLVANLPAGDLATAATLLDAGHRAVPPLEVDLEVAKVIVRRLTAEPVADAGSLASLTDGLMDLVRTYLHDRLLVREKHGAVALNAVLALLLLADAHHREVVERLKNIRQTWFTELLARRVARLAGDLRRRQDVVAVRRPLALLDEVVELFANPQSAKGPSHAGTAS